MHVSHQRTVSCRLTNRVGKRAKLGDDGAGNGEDFGLELSEDEAEPSAAAPGAPVANGAPDHAHAEHDVLESAASVTTDSALAAEHGATNGEPAGNGVHDAAAAGTPQHTDESTTTTTTTTASANTDSEVTMAGATEEPAAALSGTASAPAPPQTPAHNATATAAPEAAVSTAAPAPAPAPSAQVASTPAPVAATPLQRPLQQQTQQFVEGPVCTASLFLQFILRLGPLRSCVCARPRIRAVPRRRLSHFFLPTFSWRRTVLTGTPHEEDFGWA